MVQPKLSSHQVKLAELWLRERTHLEAQLLACRTDMERELGRTGIARYWPLIGQYMSRDLNTDI